MLEIKDLRARVGDNEILQGLSLQVNAGEVHAIMGPNGSGKSTLAHILAGRPGYEVTGGTVLFRGKDLLALSPEERAREGVFLAFQYPVEIPGVSNIYFLKAALNALRKHRGQPELDALDFLALVRERSKVVEIDEELVKRPVNEGFSGGEKKRNEIFQMAILEPALAILDETDSGLDIDALRIVAAGVNRLRSPERAMIVVTHYQRLLDHIVPDFVHVLVDGRIVRSGGKEMALELEEKGYCVAREGASTRGSGAVTAVAEERSVAQTAFEGLRASRRSRRGFVARGWSARSLPSALPPGACPRPGTSSGAKRTSLPSPALPGRDRLDAGHLTTGLIASVMALVPRGHGGVRGRALLGRDVRRCRGTRGSRVLSLANARGIEVEELSVPPGPVPGGAATAFGDLNTACFEDGALVSVAPDFDGCRAHPSASSLVGGAKDDPSPPIPVCSSWRARGARPRWWRPTRGSTTSSRSPMPSQRSSWVTVPISITTECSARVTRPSTWERCRRASVGTATSGASR